MPAADLTYILVSAIASFIACFFSALSGGGAGLILLPILLAVGLPYVNALAAHKMAVAFIGVGSGLRFLKTNNVDLKLFLFHGLLGIPFVFLGVEFSEKVSGEIMKPAIGVIVIAMILLKLRKKEEGLIHQAKFPKGQELAIYIILMLLISFYSGWISVASGVFTTMLFIRMLGYDQLHANAMSLCAVGLFWNGVGALMHALLGHMVWGLAPGLIIGAVSGSYLGASLGLKAGNKIVKVTFQISALVTGIYLIVKSV